MSAQSNNLFSHVFEFTLIRDRYTIDATFASSEMKVTHFRQQNYSEYKRVCTMYEFIGDLDEIKYLIMRAKFYSVGNPSIAKTLMNSVLDLNRLNVYKHKPIEEPYRF